MKKLVMLTVIAACIALCAAVWPQGKTVGETPEPMQGTKVRAPEALAAPLKGENVDSPQTEEENTESPQPELPMETASESKPASTPATHETQPTPKPTEAPVVPAIQPMSVSSPPPHPTPEPAPVETDNAPQAGKMVYVQGFGWLESQGEGTVIHDEMIYENGNKVGSMG